MNESQSIVEIKVFGKTYHVECSSGEKENLFRAANYLEEQMRLIQAKNHGRITGERLLIITALNLANDLLTARHIFSKNEEKLNQHIQEISNKLIKKITRDSIDPTTKIFGATL